MGWQREWGAAVIGSDARPVRRGDMVALSTGELFDLTQGAKARSLRAFWRGIVIGGLLVGATFIGGAALGETIHIGRTWINGDEAQSTTISIARSTEPGEWAVVTMENRHVNDGGDSGAYALTLDGVPVGIRFVWDSDEMLGSDAVTVTPPQGMTCVPDDCTATVMEGFTGRVVLIDWRGM
jgi:hypothetical protein